MNPDTYTVQIDAAVGPVNYLYASLYKSESAKWGYCLNEINHSPTDYENFVCGFDSQEAATDHANEEAWRMARDQANDSGIDE